MENDEMARKLNHVRRNCLFKFRCCVTKNAFTQVQQWLESLFTGEDIPDYEINSHTVNVLYAMATQSERKAALATVAIEDIEQKNKEYIAESKCSFETQNVNLYHPGV